MRIQVIPALQVERTSIFWLFPVVTSGLSLYGGFLSKSIKRFLYTVEFASFSKADDAFAITKAKCFGYLINFPKIVKYKNFVAKQKLLFTKLYVQYVMFIYFIILSVWNNNFSFWQKEDFTWIVLEFTSQWSTLEVINRNSFI